MKKFLYVTSISLEKEKNTGNKIHFVEIGKALKNLGNEVSLIAPYYSDSGSREDYGLVDLQIPLKKKNFWNYWRFHSILSKRITGILQEQKPDFVYVRDLLNTKRIKAACGVLGIPVIGEINELISETSISPAVAQWFFSRKQNETIIHSDFLRVMIPKTKEKILHRFKKKKPNTIFVIPHGTNPDLFFDRGKGNSRTNLGFKHDEFLFLFVGTLNFSPYFNGLGSFLEAFSSFQQKVPNTRFFLLGDGKFRKPLEEKAKSLGIEEKVHFMGYRKNEEVPNWISAADICLQVWVSEDKNQQGLSLKLSSYLACERRILLTDMHSFREITEPFDPLLWNPQAKGDMERCLWKAWQEKDSWNKGKAQREFVKKNMTWEISAKKIVEILG